MTLHNELKAASRQYTATRADKTLRFAQEREYLEQTLAQQSSTSKLMLCTTESIVAAVIQAGSIGLSLNPILKHCYLIPRRVKVGNDQWQWQAYASPSYIGLVSLAINSGAIKHIAAEIVFEDDNFTYRGPFEKPEHVAVISSKLRGPEKAVGVYTGAKLPDGDWSFTYEDSESILKSRYASDNSDSLMWTKFWREGWKKTALRRHLKILPGSAQSPLYRAMHHMDRYDDPIDFDAMKTVRDAEPELISSEQLDELNELMKDAGLTKPAREKWAMRLATRLKAPSLSDLSSDKFDEAKALLTQGLNSKATTKGNDDDPNQSEAD